jgi:hypothetical protein
MKEYRYKVPNGKLIIIKIDIFRNKINKFQLLGDFFLYPEEKVSLIEKSLVSATQEKAPMILKNVINKEKIILLGLSVEDIILLVNRAFEDLNNEK